MVTAIHAPHVAVLAEIDRWKRLGVAVFPGPRGEKGPRERGWPDIPHDQAWCLAREAAAWAPINLVVRTGATADGARYLAAIDLDGKCPCGHDRADHLSDTGACMHVPKHSEAACNCAGYKGVAPEVALRQLLEFLPSGVAISRTARGFHIIFWVARPLPNGTLPAYSADVFGGRDPHALQVAPSLHPTGSIYEWVREPSEDLPTVDLEALGLAPAEPIDAPHRSGGGRGRGTPASQAMQTEFEALMAEVGVLPRSVREEFHRCAWHAESEDSLHVDWQAAVFHCFGCHEQGGLRRLHELVGGALPPSYNPLSEGEGGIGRGLQLGGRDARAERDRLADALDAIGEHDRAQRMRECREANFDATDKELAAFACPNGDATPVKAHLRSCDDPQCPTCMPWRLAADWNHHWTKDGEEPPQHLTLARLRAVDCSIGLDDWRYIRRVRAQFREWQRARGLRGGFYGLTVERDGDCWRAQLLVAVGDGDAAQLRDGRAFSVELLGHDLDSRAILRSWQHSLLNEATAWRDLAELAAFRALIKGRRKFQGFGTAFSATTKDEEADEMDQQAAQPLHRMAGGSGKASKQQPCCPRCGERLKRVGRFDPQRMELLVGADGVAEWRWKTAR